MREFSVKADFAVGDRDTVAGSVFAHERDDPDHVIFQRLVDGSWTDVTCAEAAQQIRQTAQGLIAHGVNAGDRVAILSGTRYEWVILDYAILSAGAVTVPIYDTSSADQVRCSTSSPRPAGRWRSAASRSGWRAGGRPMRLR